LGQQQSIFILTPELLFSAKSGHNSSSRDLRKIPTTEKARRKAKSAYGYDSPAGGLRQIQVEGVSMQLNQ